jgi:hypothetical protein
LSAGVRARLLARAGDLAAAEEVTASALRRVEATDALHHHGRLLLEAAEVKRLAGRESEAVELVEEGHRLFELKQDRASATAARDALAALKRKERGAPVSGRST